MISLKMGCEKFVGSGKWVGPVVLMSDWAGYSRCLGAAQIGVIFGLIWCQKNRVSLLLNFVHARNPVGFYRG